MENGKLAMDLGITGIFSLKENDNNIYEYFFFWYKLLEFVIKRLYPLKFNIALDSYDKKRKLSLYVQLNSNEGFFLKYNGAETCQNSVFRVLF